MTDGGHVGRVAGDKRQRRCGAQESCQGLLQIPMHLFFSGNQPAGAGAGAVAVDRGFGATGDLAYKKIFPALQAMAKRGHLNVPVVGVAKAS